MVGSTDSEYDPKAGGNDNPFDGKPESDKKELARQILAALDDAETTFDKWDKSADRIDRLISQGSALSDSKFVTDEEFSLFWANTEVIKPSIYSRPPEPVVQPKHKDRRPDRRVTSEVLERTISTIFDMTDINEVMKEIRDDLTIVGRGSPWVTYDSKDKKKRIYVDHKDRKDFLHQPARKWPDVGWVAGRAWLTRQEAIDRFGKEKADELSYENNRQDRDSGATDSVLKAGVWEVWSKVNDRVYWVSKGSEEMLDDKPPHLDLDFFFPCPKPAYSGKIRRSLVPMPDISFYEPQLRQINDLTTRIHDLCEQLMLKGFFPSGGDVGDAVKAALSADDTAILIPINAAVLGNADITKLIVWLPLEAVANTIQTCIMTRTQLIEDVQQLMGIADIMRADTNAEETLGAQKLKVQYGSVRIRDKVQELVRVARDITRICGAIVAQKFTKDDLLDYSQMVIPTNSEIKKEVADLNKQVKSEMDAAMKECVQKAQQLQMQAQQQGQPPPPEAMQEIEQTLQQHQQQIMEQYQPQIEKAASAVSIEMVMDLLRDKKIAPFVFDIETDSTVYPDEQQEKQDRAEFMTAFAQSGQTLEPLVATGPEGAALAGAMLKFSLAPFKAGRELEMLVDEWVEAVGKKAGANQDQGAQEKLAEANQMLAKAEQAKAAAAMEKVKADAADNAQQLKAKIAQLTISMQSDKAKAMLDAQELKTKAAETQKKMDLMDAQIKEILAGIQIDSGKLRIEGAKVQVAAQSQQEDAAVQREGLAMQRDQANRDQFNQDRERFDANRDRNIAEDQRTIDNETNEDQRQFDNEQRIEDRKAEERSAE